MRLRQQDLIERKHPEQYSDKKHIFSTLPMGAQPQVAALDLPSVFAIRLYYMKRKRLLSEVLLVRVTREDLIQLRRWARESPTPSDVSKVIRQFIAERRGREGGQVDEAQPA
jgi:hypothetical protein